MRRACIVLTVFLLLASPCFSGDQSLQIETESPSSPTVFVDRDGDGIDDNLIDTDGDGLPDKRQFLSLNVDGGNLSAQSGIFAGQKGGFEMSFSQGNSTQFSDRFCRSRCLSLSRGGFGSLGEFGPGNGIGIGAVNGTNCVGGVCGP